MKDLGMVGILVASENQSNNTMVERKTTPYIKAVAGGSSIMVAQARENKIGSG